MLLFFLNLAALVSSPNNSALPRLLFIGLLALSALVLLAIIAIAHRKNPRIDSRSPDNSGLRAQAAEQRWQGQIKLLKEEKQALLEQVNALQAELELLQKSRASTDKGNAIGRLIEGIIDEVNEPLTYVYTNTYHLRKHSQTIDDFFGELALTIDPELITGLMFKYDIDYTMSDNAKIISGFESTLTRALAILQTLGSFRPQKLDLQQTPIRPALQDAAYHLSREFPQVQLQVSEELQDVRIVADNEQLALALRQVLSNAAEAMQGQGKITIHADREAGFTCLEVNDQGPGVATELREMVFDPFYTGSSDPRKLGLGLTIARNIIVHHHGKIHFSESEHRSGASVRICLPLAAGS
jgi:signal transduction histidine kinase